MKTKVLLFGMLSDHTRNPSVNVEDVRDTDQLKRRLEERYPSLKGMQYNISVNQEIYKECVELYDGDEVALLPPFAGG
ncbi:MAG: MoaD/ThiS family protein [Flavobacteriales bacterium]|nr:MoaD/ThiS family protein [Flavobacteriales bacterium]